MRRRGVQAGPDLNARAALRDKAGAEYGGDRQKSDVSHITGAAGGGAGLAELSPLFAHAFAPAPPPPSLADLAQQLAEMSRVILAQQQTIAEQNAMIARLLAGGGSLPAPAPPPAPTLVWVWDRYVQARALKSRWWAGVLSMMKDPIEQLGHLPIDQLSATKWEAYRDMRTDLKGSSRNLILTWIRSALKWAHQEKLIGLDPLVGAKRERTKTRRRTVVSEADEERILELASPMFAAAVVLGTEAGLRRSEIARSLASAVDLEAATFTVAPNVSKTKRGRIVPLNRRAVEYLRRYRDSLAPEIAASAWLFPSPATNGRTHIQAEWITRQWRGCVKDLGLQGHPDDGRPTYHDTRRSSASRDMRAGAKTMQLMAKFGWTNPGQVETYVVASESDAEALRDVRDRELAVTREARRASAVASLDDLAEAVAELVEMRKAGGDGRRDPVRADVGANPPNKRHTRLR